MICKEIVFKNDYGNCVTNDTGILTVSSRKVKSNEQFTIESILSQTNAFEIEFDYHYALDEEIEKFDEHLCAFTACRIEQKIKENIKRSHRKECSQCIDIFNENIKLDNDYITRTAQSKPCKSTVDIIKATNRICTLLENDEDIDTSTALYNRTLKTIMSHLVAEELYAQSDFENHDQRNTSSNITHQEEFIFKIVVEYMKMKSNMIGNRITEEERGKYIRCNYKKRVHEAGQ